MYEIGNIYSYYLKWKQVYNNYVTSDRKPQSFFEEIWGGGDVGVATPKGHYLRFISNTLDIMDVFPSMKGFHIVIDNAPINSSDALIPS
jgi:hypothetical protein